MNSCNSETWIALHSSRDAAMLLLIITRKRMRLQPSSLSRVFLSLATLLGLSLLRRLVFATFVLLSFSLIKFRFPGILLCFCISAKWVIFHALIKKTKLLHLISFHHPNKAEFKLD
ncbi:hypothetical protein OIU78_014907 [Salix suchowensis]|nr:hypothetical protein OIU78_014907 [Salix suchowensis]